MLDRTKEIEMAHSPQETVETIVPKRKPSLVLKIAKGGLQIVLMAAILGGSIFAMMRLIDSKPKPKARQAFKTVYTVKTTTVAHKNHQPVFVSYGQIEAARKVDLRSLVSGEVVAVSDKLRAGTRIKVGEALVEIDRFNYEGALHEAGANLKETIARLNENRARIVSENSKLASMRDQLAIAERDLARAKSLRKRGTVTQQQVEVRTLVVSQRQQSLNLSENMVKIEQARLGQQEAAIERLEWRLQQAKRNLENTVLKAPFTGIIRSSSVDVGKLVSANDVVVSLYQPDKLEAKFTLTDAQFGRLQNDPEGLIARKVTISWSIGNQVRKYAGSIERIGAEINSSRGGVEVYARLLSGGERIEIRPGAFVEIEVPDRMFKKTAKLPEQAIYNGGHVYVMAEGKLHKRPIKIVAYDGENVLVSEGLQEGEKVLTTRIAEVGEGLRVREEQPVSTNEKLQGDDNQNKSARQSAAVKG
jgi:RND family efflux transporter MFP subunit